MIGLVHRIVDLAVMYIAHSIYYGGSSLFSFLILVTQVYAKESLMSVQL